MGEYERTSKMIKELEEKKKMLESKIDELYEDIYRIDAEIGECRGYLNELSTIDGG